MNLTEKGLEARRTYMREYKSNMSQEAREALNRYNREYRRMNPDKIRRYNETYWERKADNDIKKDVTDTVTDTVTDKLNVTTCQECGEEFSPKRSDARFCSTSCRVNYNRKKHS